MRVLLTLLLFASVTVLGQEATKLSEQTTLVNGGQFKGVVFSADYELPIFDHTDKGRFTPTPDDVIKLEKELKKRIKDINKNRPNQGRHYGPIIDERLSKYSRQYAGFINDKGERVIHVGLNWKRYDREWKKEFILVFDGGSYHWSIRYNLDTEEFLQFSVNGIASLPNGSQHQLFAIAGVRSKLKSRFQTQSRFKELAQLVGLARLVPAPLASPPTTRNCK